MKAQARTNIIRISPMKVGWDIEHIKYKDVTEAFSILENSKTKASRILHKLLTQAVANATTNHGMSVESLYIKNCVANSGPIIKRFSARAKGSADKIDKKTSLIVLTLEDERPNKKKPIKNSRAAAKQIGAPKASKQIAASKPAIATKKVETKIEAKAEEVVAEEVSTNEVIK